MRFVGLLLGCALLTGCAALRGAEDTTGGMGVPQQFPSEEFPGDRGDLTTRVQLAANGCFVGSLPDTGETGEYLIVWPAGTELGSSGSELRLPDGTPVRDGDVLKGQGLLMPTNRLAGFGADGYWDSAVGFCAPGDADVLVLDSVVRR